MKVTKRKFGAIVSIIVALVMISGVVVAIAYQDRLAPGNGYGEKYGQRNRNQHSLPNYHAYEGSYPCRWMRGYHGNASYHGWCQNCYNGYGNNHYRHYRW